MDVLNFRCTFPQDNQKKYRTRIYRCGHGQVLSQTGLRTLKSEYGIKHWFDLRTGAEKNALPDFNEEHIVYHAFPLYADDQLPRIPTVNDYVQYYQCLILQNKMTLKSFFLILYECLAAPCMIACYAGKDRTGVLCYLIHQLLGTSPICIERDFIASTAALLSCKENFIHHAQKKNLDGETYFGRFLLCADVYQVFHQWFLQKYVSMENFLKSLCLPNDFSTRFIARVNL